MLGLSGLAKEQSSGILFWFYPVLDGSSKLVVPKLEVTRSLDESWYISNLARRDGSDLGWQFRFALV